MHIVQVGDALLDVIFDPEEADAAGLVIDGFPRTALQADFLKLLYDKMMSLHNKYANTEDEWRFPRPSFKARTSSTCFAGCCGWRGFCCSRPCHAGHQTCRVLLLGDSKYLRAAQQPSVFPTHSFHSRPVQVVVLYVEQEESVRRQMMRAQLASLHNQCGMLHTPSPSPAETFHLAVFQMVDATLQVVLRPCITGQNG